MTVQELYELCAGFIAQGKGHYEALTEGFCVGMDGGTVDDKREEISFE